MAGPRVGAEHHEEIGEARHGAAVVRAHAAERRPVRVDGLSVAAAEVDGAHVRAGDEAGGVDDDVRRMELAGRRADAVGRDLDDRRVRERHVRPVQRREVSPRRVADAALAADLEVRDQEGVVFRGRHAAHVRRDPRHVASAERGGPAAGALQTVAPLREEEDGEAVQVLRQRDVSQRPPDPRRVLDVRRGLDPVLAADELRYVAGFGRDRGEDLRGRACVEGVIKYLCI